MNLLLRLILDRKASTIVGFLNLNQTNASVRVVLSQEEDCSGTPVKVQKTESAAELEMS